MAIVTRKHRKWPSKQLKRIRAAVQAGKRKKAKWLAIEFLRSREAKRLAVRLAYRAMPLHRRPHRSKLDAIAEALDPWKGSNAAFGCEKGDDWKSINGSGPEGASPGIGCISLYRRSVVGTYARPDSQDRRDRSIRGQHPSIGEVQGRRSCDG
jgi:hypothetical protein